MFLLEFHPKNADRYNMKRLSASLLLLCMAAFVAPVRAAAQGGELFRQEGIASWYGPEFDGRPTASGEIFNSAKYTAAHPTLPFGTVLLVTNRHNNRQITVTVNDRGPFVAARIIDVSRAAAEQLDMLFTGTAPVIIEGMVPYGTEWNRTPQPAPVQPVQVTPAPVVTVPAPPQSPPASACEPSKTFAVKLTPDIQPLPNKVYKLQIGSYKVARNAVAAFEKLKKAGLDPSYERGGEYYRVVLAGLRGDEVPSVTEKLAAAGFREAVIREDK
jgi:rare lipoprotein A